MDIKDICDELDFLKLKILTSSEPPKKTELQEYEEWVDEMQGRSKFRSCFEEVFNPTRYAEYNTICHLVVDLYNTKYRKDKRYSEREPEVIKIIMEAVAMTLFYSKKI